MVFQNLIKELDNLSSNKERKEYIYSLLRNPNIPKDSLLRIACITVQEENFIDKYYTPHFKDLIKKGWFELLSFFIRFSNKNHFYK